MRRFDHRYACLVLVAILAAATVVAGCSQNAEGRKRRFFESGNRYFEKGDHRAAIIEYRNAIEIDPLFGEARAKLAESYAQEGDGPNALAEYVRSADLLKNDLDLQLRAGSLLLAAGQLDQALAKSEAILKVRPQDITALILRGNALAGLNSFDEALEAIEEAIRVDPARGSSFTQKGLIALAGGRRDEAEAAFKKAIELAPESVEAHLALGNYYWFTGRAPETEAAFRDALKNHPDDVSANRAMAALALATGKTSDAERYLRTIADASKDTASIFSLVDYYLLAGRHEDAIARLMPLASATPPVSGSQERLARAWAASGNKGKARDLVDSMLAADKANLQAHVVKGQILLDDGKREEALTVVKEAVALNPKSVEAQFILGRMYAARGDVAAAEAAFREVLRINPRVAAAQMELARLQLSSGNASASIRTAEEAIRNDPANVSTRLTLVRSLLATREIARAEREIVQLSAAHSGLAEVHVQMGVLAGLKNDPRTARAEFERALAIDANSIEALTGLIELDIRARDSQSARNRIEGRVKGNATPEMLLLAARTYAALNDLPATEAFLRRAIETDSTLLPAYAMLGQLYLSQKKVDDARVEFEKLAARQTNPVAALTMSGIILQTQGKAAEAQERYERVLSI